jgi:hypothetical protein
MSGFTCPFCHLIFLLRTEFESHVRTGHPERQPSASVPVRALAPDRLRL